MATTFMFTGRTRAGESVSGERIAESADAAVAALRRDEILVNFIDASSKAATDQKDGALGQRVPVKDLAVFTRQFSVMIDAGLPLVDCLNVLGRQEHNASFGQTILDVRTAVEGGLSLADAMRGHPRCFDALYTSMIAAGEAGGVLDVILSRLADFIEKSAKLRSQVSSALMYPAAVMLIATLMVAAIMWLVIPTFASLFDGLGAALPMPTRLVIWMSDSFVSMLPILLVGAVAGFFGLRRAYASVRGRRTIDRALLQVPIIGPVLRKVAVARFCRTLATLLGSGVPILDGLEITAKTAGNAVVEDAVLTARTAIESGRTIAEPLGETGVFPPMVMQMVSIGETTGALDTMLEKIAEFYDAEVDTAVAGMLSLLEPIMIALLGVIVGGIVIAMYLPIFDLISRMAG